MVHDKDLIAGFQTVAERAIGGRGPVLLVVEQQTTQKRNGLSSYMYVQLESPTLPLMKYLPANVAKDPSKHTHTHTERERGRREGGREGT